MNTNSDINSTDGNTTGNINGFAKVADSNPNPDPNPNPKAKAKLIPVSTPPTSIKTPRTVCYRYADRPSMYRGPEALPWTCRFGDTCTFTHFNPALGEFTMDANVIAGLIHPPLGVVSHNSPIAGGSSPIEGGSSPIAGGSSPMNTSEIDPEPPMEPPIESPKHPHVTPVNTRDYMRDPLTHNITPIPTVPLSYVPLSVVNTPLRDTQSFDFESTDPNPNPNPNPNPTDAPMSIEKAILPTPQDQQDQQDQPAAVNNMNRQSARKPSLNELSEFKFGYLGHSYTFQVDKEVKKMDINDMSDESDDENDGNGNGKMVSDRHRWRECC